MAFQPDISLSTSMKSSQSYSQMQQAKSKLLESKRQAMPDIAISKCKSETSNTFLLKRTSEGYAFARHPSSEPFSFVLDALPDWNVQTLQHLIAQLDKKVHPLGHSAEPKSKQVIAPQTLAPLLAAPLALSFPPASESSIPTPIPSRTSTRASSAGALSLAMYDLQLPANAKMPNIQPTPVVRPPRSSLRAGSILPDASFRQTPLFNGIKRRDPPPNASPTQLVSEWVTSCGKPTKIVKTRKQSQTIAAAQPSPLISSTSLHSIATTASYFTSYSSRYPSSQLLEPVRLGKLGMNKDAEFERRTEKMRKSKAYSDSLRKSHVTTLPKKMKSKTETPPQLVSAASEQRKRILEYAQTIPKPKPITLPPISKPSQIPVRTVSAESTNPPPMLRPEPNALEMATRLYYEDRGIFERLKSEFQL